VSSFVEDVDSIVFAAANDGGRPTIEIRPGERDRLVKEAVDALCKLGRAYQIGGIPVVIGHEIMQTLEGKRTLLRRVLLTRPTMTTELARAARWCAFDKKGRLVLKEPI
jgi:hypothetical protein